MAAVSINLSPCDLGTDSLSARRQSGNNNLCDFVMRAGEGFLKTESFRPLYARLCGARPRLGTIMGNE